MANTRGAISSAAASKAAELARINALKKGKTPEQQRVIDFFFTDPNGGCLKKNNTSVYTFEEYRNLVAKKCSDFNFRQKAIDKIGLDESQIQEIPPVMLSSFVFDNDVLIKTNNNEAVSSQYSVTWIFFSAMQMYTYQFIYDMTSDNTWEYTKDYFYTDITCFSTQRYVKEKIESSLGSGCLSKNKESVNKSLYVIDRLEIIVPGSAYSFSLRNSDTIEQSIQAAKAMIREKKYSK